MSKQRSRRTQRVQTLPEEVYAQALKRVYSAMDEEGDVRRERTPEGINTGFCDDFAEAVRELLPEIIIESDDLHTWIVWNNRYYDATHPSGCLTRKELLRREKFYGPFCTTDPNKPSNYKKANLDD